MRIHIALLALANLACASIPVFTEPRAYVASSSTEVGRGLWSRGDAAYATQSGSVVRYQRTKEAVVKTDSVYLGSMTETPMYIAKDSLHGFAVGNDAVCMIDWSVHPGKLGRCAPIRGFGHGSFTGGLALGRYLDLCNPVRALSFDTQGDSLLLLDSITLGGLGGLRCQIEGELVHMVSISAGGFHRSNRMANNLHIATTSEIDSSAVGDFFWSPGQGAGLLALDSNGVFDRLKWGSLAHSSSVSAMAHLKDRYKSASQSDSNIVVASDSTLYLVRWTNSDEPVMAASLSFEADLYGAPGVAVDGAYAWVRTPTGLLSLLIQERTTGVVAARKEIQGQFAVHGRTLEFAATKSGMAKILSPDGSVLADLPLRAGSASSWTSTRRGLHLVRLDGQTVSVMFP